VHLRIATEGVVAVTCKHAGAQLTNGVVRCAHRSDALRLLEDMLKPFATGDQLFIVVRDQESRISLWSTISRAAGLYWCASALAQLWTPALRASSAEQPRLSSGKA